jgi:heat-inducible transcriptional repressor
VASRQVAQSTGLGLSPATFRHVMSELEERQLLARPHTSAGCVPTDAGLRAYVDTLDPGRALPVATRRRIEERVLELQRELHEGLEWVAELVAGLTREAGIAVRPMGEELTLEAVSLVPIGAGRLLGIVVTSEGSIMKAALSVEEREIPAERAQRLASYLSRRFYGESLERIPQLLEESARCADTVTEEGRLVLLAWAVARELFAAGHPSAEVLVAGAGNLFEAGEFEQVERIRSALATLQDRAAIVREWRKVFDKGPTQVIIGGESSLTSSGQLGMVATLFFRGGRRAGALGVVGPRRMDYFHIVPLVEYIGDTLTRVLEQPGAMHA